MGTVSDTAKQDAFSDDLATTLSDEMNEEPTHKQSIPPLDTSTRLAYERTYLAHERTLMGVFIHVHLCLIPKELCSTNC